MRTLNPARTLEAIAELGWNLGSWRTSSFSMLIHCGYSERCQSSQRDRKWLFRRNQSFSSPCQLRITLSWRGADDLLSGAGVTLDDPLLDRIDKIVPPGTDVAPLEGSGYTPPAIQVPALRRRPITERAAA